MLSTALRICLIISAILLLGGAFPVLAQEEGTVLFEDNFEDSKVLPGWLWSEDDHDLARVATDGENRVLRMVGGGNDSTFMFIDDSADWENYALELRFKIVQAGNSAYDLVLVVNEDLDAGSSTGAVLSQDNGEAALVTVVEDDDQRIASEDFDFQEDEWYSARFAVQGDLIQFMLNGEMLLEEETNDQSDQGGAGIICGEDSVILIDDVRVVELASNNELVNEIDIGSLIDNNNNDNGGDEPQVVASVEVTVNTANLRAGPSTEFDVVGTARRGDTFDVLAQTGNGDDIWYLIVGEDPEIETWIFSGTVQLAPEDAEVPDVEDVQP